MENIKSSDEISVIIWIEIQICLTICEVLKKNTALGDSMYDKTTYYSVESWVLGDY